MRNWNVYVRTYLYRCFEAGVHRTELDQIRTQLSISKSLGIIQISTQSLSQVEGNTTGPLSWTSWQLLGATPLFEKQVAEQHFLGSSKTDQRPKLHETNRLILNWIFCWLIKNRHCANSRHCAIPTNVESVSIMTALELAIFGVLRPSVVDEAGNTSSSHPYQLVSNSFHLFPTLAKTDKSSVSWPAGETVYL